MSPPSIFAQANDVLDVGALVGQASGEAWRHLRKAPCPICQGLGDFSFKRTAWRCHRSGERGSALDLQAAAWGCDAFEAACRVLGLDIEQARKEYAQRKGPARAPAQKPAPKVAPTPRAAPIDDDVSGVVARVRADARSGAGTLVECYFASRGLPRRFAALVWFTPDAPYDIGALYGRGRSFPAMVCFPEVDGRQTGGVHLTYLRPDGAGKAELRAREPAKKMWGPQTDAQGRPGGMRLLTPASFQLLCVAEGVENALACATAGGDGVGAFATGSLDRLQGGMALNRWRRIDWRAPAADPDKPAATMRHKGPVLICTDSDMSPLIINRGTRFEQTISSERRAAVSGVLAGHWWRRAGAADVRVLTPPKGKDANDVIREQRA